MAFGARENVAKRNQTEHNFQQTFRYKTVGQEYFIFSHNPLKMKLQPSSSLLHPLNKVMIPLNDNSLSQVWKLRRGFTDMENS